MRWTVVLAVPLVIGLALLLWAWIRRIRQRLRLRGKRAPRLRHPVVLAHGLLGFDEIALAGRKHRYFRDIAHGLRALDAKFHHPQVHPTASIAVRAARLADLVRELPGGRVNIIAHSMGGLDARYAISRLGLADRVASLVTIGTPHQGTPIADLGAKVVPQRLAAGLARVFDVRALHDLTTASLERFNREVPDGPGIVYCSVVGTSKLTQTHPLLWPTHAILTARCGSNDGIVCATSQRWGQVLAEIEADHWAQIGWSPRFDAVALYGQILNELVGLGL